MIIYDDFKEIGGVDKLGVSSADTKPPDLTKVLIHSQDFVSVDPLPNLSIRSRFNQSLNRSTHSPHIPVHHHHVKLTDHKKTRMHSKSYLHFAPYFAFSGEKLVSEWIW